MFGATDTDTAISFFTPLLLSRTKETSW